MEGDEAEREGLELTIHSNLIVTSVEELLRLVLELKLSKLTMDWAAQDESVENERKHHIEEELKARKKIRTILDEVKVELSDMDRHLNRSRSKKSRLAE